MAHLEHLYYFIAMTIFICCFFASELQGYSRTLSVLFRAIPLLSLFCLLFLHRSITDIHGRVRVSPCYSVAIIILFVVRCYDIFVTRIKKVRIVLVTTNNFIYLCHKLWSFIKSRYSNILHECSSNKIK